MHANLRKIKDRDKRLVRVHPDIYDLVQAKAKARGSGKTETLERLLILGLAFDDAQESLSQRVA